MSNKLGITCCAALVAALGGCGSDATPETEKMDSADANMLAELTEVADDNCTAPLKPLPDIQLEPYYPLPDDLTLPPPLATQLMALKVDSIPDAHECMSTSDGWLDADGDGMPVAYSVAFGCRDQIGKQMTSTVIGRVVVDDLDDADPKSGVRLEWHGLDITQTPLSSSEGWTLTRSLNGTLQFGHDKDERFAVIEDYVVTQRTEDVARGIDDSGSLTRQGIIVYTGDDAADPFAAGSFNFATGMDFSHNGRKHRLTANTDPFVHYSASCKAQNPELAGLDSGAVVYADGATVRVSYEGCEEYSVTLDGAPL